MLIGVHGACVHANRDRQRETDRDNGGAEELPLRVMGIAELVRQSNKGKSQTRTNSPLPARRIRKTYTFGKDLEMNPGGKSRGPETTHRGHRISG